MNARNQKTEGIALDIELQLRGDNARRLIDHAKRRGKPPAELLSDIIEIVLRDNLVAAVLDTEEK